MRVTVAALAAVLTACGPASAQPLRVFKQPVPAGVDRAQVRYGCWVVAFGRRGGPDPYEFVAVTETKSEAARIATRLAVSDRIPGDDRLAYEVLMYGLASPGEAAARETVSILREHAAKLTQFHDELVRDRERLTAAILTLKPSLVETVNETIGIYNDMRRLGAERIGFHVADAPPIAPLPPPEPAAPEAVPAAAGEPLRLRLVVDREGPGFVGTFFVTPVLTRTVVTRAGEEATFEGAAPHGWDESKPGPGRRVRVTAVPRPQPDGSVAVRFTVRLWDRPEDGAEVVATVKTIERSVRPGEPFRFPAEERHLRVSAYASTGPDGEVAAAAVSSGPNADEPRCVLRGVIRLGASDPPAEAPRPAAGLPSPPQDASGAGAQKGVPAAPE